MELGSNFVQGTKPSTKMTTNTIMAQKPPAGKIKKFFAKLACHRDPDLSPNPSPPPSTNPNRPPSPNASRLPFPNPTPPSANPTPPSPIHSRPASPNHSRPPSPKPSRPTSPNSAKPPTAHQAPQQHDLKDSAKTAWNAMETVLRLLKESADAFPPLKSAVGGLVACLDLAKDVIGNQKEYKNLAVQFEGLARTLVPYASMLTASDDGRSIALPILISIDEEVAEINRQLKRSKSRRTVEATNDQGDILARYRKIDSLFRNLLSDVTLRTLVEVDEAAKTKLLSKLAPVNDAIYNSEYSTAVKRRGCTASTREQILDDLREWAHGPQGSRVYWINGMAGTGKTTILYSFCKWLEDNNQLAGNFFCSRTSTACRDLHNIVRTVAHQLAHYSPAFCSHLCKVLKEKPNAHSLNVGEQFKLVVATPLEKMKDAIPDGAVIVIDALDECGDVSATAQFLKVLMAHAIHLPIKFLVASRPESVIVKNMQAPNFSPAMLRLHDVEQSFVEADIRSYLQEALNTMSPSPEDIDQLAQRSGKLFIYAATAARYVNPEGIDVNSQKRLKMILGILSSSDNRQYQDLDNLYTGILMSTFDKDNFNKEELDIAALVLRTVICAIEPMTISTMSTILALEQEDVASTLARLQSVLHVQEGPSGLVSMLHASFPDFLFNKDRSHEFHCNAIEHNTKLAHSCFDMMSKELHFNMCNLKSSYDFDEDMPDLEEKIQANISAALLYACKYWSNHLVHCDLTSSIHYQLVKFLKFHLLFWMEVLNLTKFISTGSKLLSDTLNWFIRKAPGHTFKETEKELYDADLFVKTFSLGACKKSTPHIYISALPFCYKSNSVYQNYWSKTKGLIVVNGTSLTRQHNGPIGVWKSDSWVHAVTFSPDGRTFASGGVDGVLNIQDVQSGEILFSPLLEIAESIMVVVFSPDNCKIAAGSNRGNIWMWDIHTASLIAGPLLYMDGGEFVTMPLAFSWDSRKLALWHSTIVVWDSSSGEVLFGPFQAKASRICSSLAFAADDSNILFVSDTGMVHTLDAHTGSHLAEPFDVTNKEVGTLESTAISPDTSMVAVGYMGGAIYIWDIHARTTICGPLVGHSMWASDLVFSQDGKKLISGSYDTTIRIWDVGTGNLLAGPFEGHTKAISSLALSSDGTKLISGSYDQSVRLWNVFTNENNIALPCQSVTSDVYTVAWSPDGTRIASGQLDGTVAVWSAQNGEAVIEPFHHLSIIESIAFSPNNSIISAGTEDGDVVSWDVRTREMVGEPFQGHSEDVISVAYSPDGSIIASGSKDCTIIIWDCSTSKMIGNPLHQNDWVHSVAFTPDSNTLVSGGDDGSIYVWNVHTGQIILGPIKGHKALVNSVACSPDRPQFVSGSQDGTLCVWSLTTGEMTVGPFDAHCGAVCSVTYSQDGTKIIAGFNDGTICALDAEMGNILASIAGHTSAVYSVAISPDGSKFVSGSEDRSVRVWQLDILTSPELRRNTPTIWMPEDIINPTISDIAKYHDDGWVVLDQDNTHLFWTTPEFREDLCYPCNPITIGPHGTTCINYSSSKLFIGRTWSKCWENGRQDSVRQ
ncbi:WD40 repeat-like protein [Agrocybe pediades]|nr:WD40 repeat-like protein [Agrocybe pediades]